LHRNRLLCSACVRPPFSNSYLNRNHKRLSRWSEWASAHRNGSSDTPSACQYVRPEVGNARFSWNNGGSTVKNRIWITIWLLTVLCIVGLGKVRAQSASGEFAVSPGFTLANCEAGAITSFTMYCPTGTGQLYYCLSSCTTAAGWVQVGGGAATGVQKVNGALPGATGNVTVGCTISPFGGATSDVIFAGSNSLSATTQVPSIQLTATCTGTGS
jgi:hypothetical protein